MTPKQTTAMPDLTALFEIEELDLKRKDIRRRLDEIPGQREIHKAEMDRTDRELREKEQALAAKEKSIQSLELDLKTCQTQEADKRVKLNTVKTQKEYDALKTEIDLAVQDRGKLEERILLLMDEIAELKNYSKREKQAGDAKKKELNLKLEAMAGDEKNLQTELKAINEKAQGQIDALPPDVHREYNRLRAIFSEGQILSKLIPDENTFSCSACNSPVPHQFVIEIKRGLALRHCEICRRLLFA